MLGAHTLKEQGRRLQRYKVLVKCGLRSSAMRVAQCWGGSFVRGVHLFSRRGSATGRGAKCGFRSSALRAAHCWGVVPLLDVLEVHTPKSAIPWSCLRVRYAYDFSACSPYVHYVMTKC